MADNSFLIRHPWLQNFAIVLWLARCFVPHITRLSCYRGVTLFIAAMASFLYEDPSRDPLGDILYDLPTSMLCYIKIILHTLEIKFPVMSAISTYQWVTIWLLLPRKVIGLDCWLIITNKLQIFWTLNIKTTIIQERCQFMVLVVSLNNKEWLIYCCSFFPPWPLFLESALFWSLRDCV